MSVFEEIYMDCMNAVQEEMQLPDGWIQSRTETCTDARCILIQCLLRKGMSRDYICRRTGIAKSSVKSHANGFSARIASRQMMKMAWARIGRELGLK